MGLKEKKADKTKAEFDPLQIIIDEHLLNSAENSSHSITQRIELMDKIIKEYLAYIRKLGIYVPVDFQKPVVEELGVKINEIISKKMYGCLSLEEYQSKNPSHQKKKAKKKYQSLQKIDTKKLGK